MYFMGHTYTKTIIHFSPEIYLGILYFYLLYPATLCATEIKDLECYSPVLDMSLPPSTALIKTS